MITNSTFSTVITPDQHPFAYWHNKKYQMCCCHVKTVATILGVMSIVSSFVLITYSVYNLIEPSRSHLPFDNYRTDLSSAMSIIFSILSLIFVCLMFYGLSREYHMLLMAHLVVLSLTITCWTGIFTVKFVYVIRQAESLKSAGLISMWIITLIIFFTYLILQFYYFYVSFKCYTYVKEKRTSVAAVEVYHNQWATQSFGGVAGPIRSHSLNVNGSFAPAYYTIMNHQHGPYVFPSAPPSYGSWQRPSLTGSVPHPTTTHNAWVTTSPPPTYTAAAMMPNFEIPKLS